MTPHFLDNTDPTASTASFAASATPSGRRSPWSSRSPGARRRRATAWWRRRPRTGPRGLAFGPPRVAITQDGSALDRQAREQGFLERFPMWDWVGGRTSVTSAVGLLPAALQGIDVTALLAGAAAMDEATRRRDTRRNPGALLALAWHAVGEGRGTKAMVGPALQGPSPPLQPLPAAARHGVARQGEGLAAGSSARGSPSTGTRARRTSTPSSSSCGTARRTSS